jgi:hypothetical protein
MRNRHAAGLISAQPGRPGRRLRIRLAAQAGSAGQGHGGAATTGNLNPFWIIGFNQRQRHGERPRALLMTCISFFSQLDGNYK